jgi:hypothetical protein
VALGDHVASRRCLLLLEVSTPRRLGGFRLHQSSQEDYARLWRSFVRGIVLALREPRRATLVKQDTKGDKWSSRLKC